ncbi:MAG: MscL family protein, partial [Sciscionella sp.]
MFKGFKDFVLRGNVLDLAIAVVIGTAFTAVVTAVVTSVIKPLINALGNPQAGGLKFPIRHGNPAIEAATSIDLAAVINAVINFLIIAAVVYFIL